MITPTLAVIVLAAPAATDTERIQAQLETASQLFQSGLPGDALGVLQQVAEQLGPDGEAEFPLLRFMMARCLYALGRTDEALAALDRFEALARSDDERARASEWRGRIEREQFGALRVECPAGATAHLGAERAACPATFARVPKGPVTVTVRGAGPERVAAVEVAPGETTTVEPAPPPPPPRWWRAGLTLGGGAGGLVGELPDFVEPGLGATARASAFGALRVWRMLWVEAGVGYGYETLPFEDTAAFNDGTFTRQLVDVPVRVRAELPWAALGVSLGGAVEWTLSARERVDEVEGIPVDPLPPDMLVRPEAGAESSADDLFEDMGGRLTIGVDRTFDLGPLDLRAALRHHHGLTPATTAGDARRISIEVALDLVF